MFDRQAVCRAFPRAWAKTGKRIAARMAMMAITTRSSIRVKPVRRRSMVVFSRFDRSVHDDTVRFTTGATTSFPPVGSDGGLFGLPPAHPLPFSPSPVAGHVVGHGHGAVVLIGVVCVRAVDE